MLLTSAKSFYLNDEVFYQYQVHDNSVSTTKSFKFYKDALEGCFTLSEYKRELSEIQRKLVDSYYMMLLVGVMQDYDSFNDENKLYVDKWFEDNMSDIKDSSNAIKPLGIANKLINPKTTLLYLGRYLKRKNRLD